MDKERNWVRERELIGLLLTSRSAWANSGLTYKGPQEISLVPIEWGSFLTWLDFPEIVGDGIKEIGGIIALVGDLSIDWGWSQELKRWIVAVSSMILCISLIWKMHGLDVICAPVIYQPAVKLDFVRYGWELQIKVWSHIMEWDFLSSSVLCKKLIQENGKDRHHCFCTSFQFLTITARGLI